MSAMGHKGTFRLLVSGQLSATKRLTGTSIYLKHPRVRSRFYIWGYLVGSRPKLGAGFSVNLARVTITMK